MTGQVAGKVALVTGGSSGIGAAVAELLAREGAKVVVTDIDDLKGPEIVAGIKKAGHEAVFLHQDVTSEPRWEEVVADVGQRYGRLDILVSNAGIGIAVPSIVHMSLARLAAADRDQSRRRIPVGEALAAADAPDRRRLDHHDVVAGGPARRADAGRLLRDQGRRAAVRQGDRDGVRVLWRRHPGQLGASRHHRHADLGQDSNGSNRQRAKCPDRCGRTRANWRRRSAAPATPRRSPAACCIWRPMHRAMSRARNS